MAWHTKITGQSTKIGVILIILGVLLLLSLRFWASPIARRIIGQNPPGFVDLMGIFVFFIVVGIGIFLFLWEP